MSRLRERGLRESFNLIVFLLLVIVSFATAGMVISEREQRRLSRDLNRVYQTVVLSDQIERDLLQLQLATAQGGFETEVGREQMEMFRHRIFSNVQEATQVIDTDAEAADLARLEQLIRSSILDLRAARAEGPGQQARREQADRRIQESLAAAESFAELNRDQARNDIMKARSLRQGLFVMRISISIMMTAMAIFVLRLSREHLRAVTTLRDAIQHFALGKGWSRVPRSRVTELNEVGDEFNHVVDQLERNNRERAVFLASVAHDLRTPLSALQSAVQLLSREPTLESSHRRVKVIQRQLDRLNTMVSDLQDAAGVEAGNLQLNRAESDLRAVVQDTIELFRGTSERHRIESDMPDEEVTLFFDETRIGQVLANLLSNAIKYSEEGRILVSLKVGGDVRIAVSDEGEGISRDDAARLFMPFRRLSPTMDRPGIGIGLSVSKRLVEAHGGRIEVESVRGRGSTFTIVLPCSDRDARANGGAEPMGPEDGGSALHH